MALGIDIGFGLTKACDGRRKISFPSLVAQDNSALGWDLGSRPRSYALDGTRYLAGNDAPGGMTFKDTDTIIAFSPVIIRKALDLLRIRDSGSVDLGLGLPIKDWHARKAELKARVAEHISFRSVLVFPQGVGAYAALRGSLSDNAVVLDIGFNTLDVAVISGGKVVPGECDCLPNSGISRVLLQLRRHLEREHGMAVGHEALIEVLGRKSITVLGREVDLRGVIGRLMDAYAEEVLGRFLADHYQRLLSVGSIVLTGGGARFVKLKNPRYRSTVFRGFRDPEFTNAEGFRTIVVEKTRRAEATLCGSQ